MSLLEKIWPFVEDFGVPILAVISGLTFFSLNFYLQECKKLRLMENELRNFGNLKNYSSGVFLNIGIPDIFYAFKNISNFNPRYFDEKQFSEQVLIIKYYRKFYKVAFPLIISLTVIGISINELIIDK